jgi:predicted ATPase/class 3 adenylate cyclase
MLRCYSVPKGNEEDIEVVASPPTGTVTFLFTDIEGSTKMWEQDATTMQQALARHNEILRSAIEELGGYVFKTVGDAFCCAFPTAPDALEAALEAQLLLSAQEWGEPLLVRIAMHTGAAEEKDGDYFGPPLNRVARLLSAAHGGQVLVSLPTQELVRDQLQPGTTLRDLGEHRLKDLYRPERVFQVEAPGLPNEFPPLRTLENAPNNLPLQPTIFIGREREVGEVRARLLRPEVRLLTLTGPGGTGKTRLALQVAAEVLEEFKDGVFFVPLSTVGDPGLVAPAIAGTLGLTDVGDKPLVESLKDHLRERRMLLVLDNLEQVMEATTLLDELIAAAPGLKLLATSRAPLRLYGERNFPVPPLSMPNPRRLPDVRTLSQYEAVRLFVERAQDAKPDFEITSENAPAVAEICVRLDGLPLAIELAAARIRLLTPQAMLSRLSSRLKVVTGGARNLPERQRTLRGAIEWSHDLLDYDERVLFARLSVFAGGRTLEAIEAICDAEGDLSMDVLDGVESLVEKSLLRQEEGVGGEPRFVMLETVHEYAREKLEASREAEEIRRLHIEYFLTLSEEAEPEIGGPRQGEWLERLEAEHDNMRSALSWALGGGDVLLGLRLAGALWPFWLFRGYLSEGIGWLEEALRSGTELPKQVRVKILEGAGAIENYRGNHQRSATFLEESTALYREVEDRQGLSRALNSLGHTAADLGDWRRAEALYREAGALGRELGDRERVFASLLNLGWASLCQEDYGRAAEACQEALVVAHDMKNKVGTAMVSANMGWVALGQGNPARAAELFTESLVLSREFEDQLNTAEFLEGMAGVAGAEGEGERAARLYGAAQALREALGAPLLTADIPRHEHYVAEARSGVERAVWEAAWEEGRAMSAEEVISYCLREGDRA